MDIAFDYKLTPASVVLDVGGYRGDFAAWCRETYGCGIHIFEPVRAHFKHIVERFKHDPFYWPYPCALEDRDWECDIYLRDNSSSLYSPSDTWERIKVRDILTFIQAFRFERVNLLKMNCEGSEFAILERLIGAEWINRVDQIVVQFHSNKDWSVLDTTDRLRKTHACEYRDEHWEWWKIRS